MVELSDWIFMQDWTEATLLLFTAFFLISSTFQNYTG